MPNGVVGLGGHSVLVFCVSMKLPDLTHLKHLYGFLHSGLSLLRLKLSLFSFLLKS